MIPLIASRHPLWEDRLAPDAPRSLLDTGLLLHDGREAVATSALDGRPNAILKMPADAYSPFWVGLFGALVFVALLLHSWLLGGAALVGVMLSLAAWMWP